MENSPLTFFKMYGASTLSRHLRSTTCSAPSSLFVSVIMSSKKHWYHFTCWEALLICLKKQQSNSQNFDKNIMLAPLNLFLLSSNVKFEYIYLKAHSTIGLYDISTEIIECSSEKCKNYIECYFINCLLKILIYFTTFGKKVFNNLTDSKN